MCLSRPRWDCWPPDGIALRGICVFVFQELESLKVGADAIHQDSTAAGRRPECGEIAASAM